MPQGTIEFAGFTPAHFDAYEERKWGSNRFNLERMAVREQAQALMAQVVSGLGDTGAGLLLQATQDHPTIFNNKRVDSQWVLLARSGEERQRIASLMDHERSRRDAPSDLTPQHLEAMLSLCVRQQGVEVGLKIHKNAHLDRHNLSCGMDDSERRAAFRGALIALPEAIHFTTGAESYVASAAAPEAVDAWLQSPADALEWWSLHASFDRDDALVAGVDFSGAVTLLIQALVPLYRLAAWAPDNDYVDGVALLERSSEGAESGTESSAANAASNPQPREDNWSYRPQWEVQRKDLKSDEKQPMTPSARARKRRAEMAAAALARAPKARNEQPADSGNRNRERLPRSSAPRERRSGSQEGGRGEQRNDAQAHRRSRGEKPRPQGDGDRRSHRQYDKGRPRRNPKPAVKWVDAEGEAQNLDYVRISGGLLNGKVGKVVDITSKGTLKVDIGDLVFEVPKDSATRVTAE